MMKSQLIANRCDTISKYFKEVKNTELITFEKEVELANRIQNGDSLAINELVEANLKFVIKITITRFNK